MVRVKLFVVPTAEIADRVIIRRNQNFVSGATMPVLDFESSEAVATATVPVTVSGVLSSEFATLGPVPIALIGAAYYGLASLIAWTPTSSWSRTTARTLTGLTGLAFAVSVVLFVIQAFELHAWCRFCLVSAAITTLLFVTSIWLLRRAA